MYGNLKIFPHLPPLPLVDLNGISSDKKGTGPFMLSRLEGGGKFFP